MTKLLAIRGDTFSYQCTLATGWSGAVFTGGLKFTVRAAAPESTVVTDEGALAQASVANGGITIEGQTVTITVPAAITTGWPTGSLLWDLQGVVSGVVPRVYTIDSGTILVSPDITRST